MDTEETYEDSHLVKDLRKQLNDALKANKQFEAELSEVKSRFRERSVADVLTAKGINPKVAKFIPQDVEGDEAVTNWLKENGELFGVPATAPEGQAHSGVSDETKQQLRQANALQERGVSPDKVADLELRVANAGSIEEINAALAEYAKYQL